MYAVKDVQEVRIQTDDLRVGCTLQNPLKDLLGTMLLSSGVNITEGIKEQLLKRNIYAVFVHPDDLANVTQREPSLRKIRLAKKIAQATSPAVGFKTKVDTLSEVVSYVTNNSGNAIRDEIQPAACSPYDAQQRERLVEQFDAVNKLLNSMIDGALNCRMQEGTELTAVATGYTSELIQDSHLTIVTSEELAKGPEIVPRSIRMSVLAMAIGIEMGYDAENVHCISQAGLLHDWGMFRLDARLQDPNTPFGKSDWWKIMKHPGYSVELLEHVNGISDLTRLICYQVHEIYDGSGYPTGRRGKLIHVFARILSVADTYITLVSDIRGRPALIPYDAMAYLVYQAKCGAFDAEIVRALLHTLSLFPIGSYIQLKDGSQAKVLRSNGKHFTKPVVQKLGNETGQQMTSSHEMPIINLAESDEELLGPLPTPNRREMRIEAEWMGERLWDGPDA